MTSSLQGCSLPCVCFISHTVICIGHSQAAMHYPARINRFTLHQLIHIHIRVIHQLTVTIPSSFCILLLQLMSGHLLLLFGVHNITELNCYMAFSLSRLLAVSQLSLGVLQPTQHVRISPASCKHDHIATTVALSSLLYHID